MVKLVRLRPDGHFLDPFCGSGTLLIEAAMAARRMAPGLGRRFIAETWTGAEGFLAEGFDIDPEAVSLTLENAQRAGVGKHIKAQIRDIKDFACADPYGCVVCNPPYGERLLDVSAARDLCKTMGRVFTQQRGWSYGIITPEEDFEDLFGRKADKRRKLYNGMIKCQFYQYFK